VVSQSGATEPWATAAFDPSGQLLTSWQGYLSLRNADTGAVLAPVTSTETATAPAISPDGTAVAYVTLDAGFGDAASQPIGNALHIRPWNAATASLGAPIELARSADGVVLPNFSSDGRWVAYGTGTPDATRLDEVPTSSTAVRTDGSGTAVQLTADPLDQLAHFASPVGVAGGEAMVWVAVISKRPVGGATTAAQQIWLEAFYPDRGVIAPAFHLPGQPDLLQVLHGPIALP
jgi:dipeptidyl aminopeptidase/acylaminoacyl peptidase